MIPLPIDNDYNRTALRLRAERGDAEARECLERLDAAKARTVERFDETPTRDEREDAQAAFARKARDAWKTPMAESAGRPATDEDEREDGEKRPRVPSFEVTR